MAQAAADWPHIAETSIQFRVILIEIRGGRSKAEAGFLPSSSVFSPANHYSAIAPYSFITTP
jgi:hypothetical protein